MLSLRKSITTKSILCLAMTSFPLIAEDVFDQPHYLNVNLFDASTSLPIDDGIHYIEVDIIDNFSGLSIGKERSHCMFLNGLCSISIHENNLSVLDNLQGISFVLNVPGLIDENSISYDVSNVSLSVKVPNPDGSINYEAKPVLYARVAELASNVIGDITPNSVDTLSLSIKGTEVINESGEWVGNGAIQGEKGETGATGPAGPTGPTGPSGDSNMVCSSNTNWFGVSATNIFGNTPKAMSLEFVGRSGVNGQDFYIKLFIDSFSITGNGVENIQLLESSIPGMEIEEFSGGNIPSIKFDRLGSLSFTFTPRGSGTNRVASSTRWLQGCFKPFSW
ncbi:collagen-like protein [Vibrio chagasii]|uniref:collagen-like protein n=1 Tax=Vibrio chagasii TaxID=170679 RepID=UPI003DA04131